MSGVGEMEKGAESSGDQPACIWGHFQQRRELSTEEVSVWETGRSHR